MRRLKTICSVIGFVVLLAAGAAAAPAPDERGVAREPVVVFGDKLFYVTASNEAAALRRARVIAERIEAVETDPSVAPDSIVTAVSGSSATVRAGTQTLFIITAQDAAASERPLPEAADAAAAAIRQAVENDREERSPRGIAIHAAIALAALLALAVAVLIVWRLFGYLIDAFHGGATHDRDVDIAPGVALPLRPLVEVAISFVRLVRLVAVGFMAYVCISFVLKQFPLTRSLAGALTEPFVNALIAFVTGFVAWLPQLAIIILIGFVAYETITFLRVVREEMTAGRFTIRGFEQDWIEPTYRLLSFAVFTCAVMALLPHVPGFDSPSFKAVGLVLSALLTFGSATTVANILGGVVLTYLPSFRIGDYVKIGDAEGEVVSKSLFVTQIRTLKNVVISMPNSSVISATVFNFSSMALRGETPLILHSTVTLGYDIPWRDINAALTAAALKTTHILSDPAPFVSQTALNDYNVAYQINAYTREPLRIHRIYSELHENMQDECNARGIEILSPGYHAVRDGNHTTIPQSYLPADYESPGFRVEKTE